MRFQSLPFMLHPHMMAEGGSGVSESGMFGAGRDSSYRAFRWGRSFQRHNYFEATGTPPVNKPNQLLGLPNWTQVELFLWSVARGLIWG